MQSSKIIREILVSIIIFTHIVSLKKREAILGVNNEDIFTQFQDQIWKNTNYIPTVLRGANLHRFLQKYLPRKHSHAKLI